MLAEKGLVRGSRGMNTRGRAAGRQPAVVLELTGQHYDRLVVTVENPGEVAAALA